MKIYKKILYILMLILGCLFLTACNNSSQTASEEKPIKVALTQDILSFDPMLTSDVFSEAVLRCVYSTLFDLDEELNLRSKLVNNSTMTDELTWEINLKSGVTFHDGSPLTAEDVVFSIDRAMKGGRTQKLLEMIESVEYVDENNFIIKTKEPYPSLMALFAKAETSIVSKKVVEAEGYDFTTPIGSGPFKLVSREENKNILLERNDKYFMEQAKSKFLEFVIIVTEQDRTAAFLNKEVDVLFSVSAYDCEKLKISEGVQLFQKPSTKIEYLSLNTQKDILNNPKVRLAISYAINRQNIADNVYHGYSSPASSLIPNGIIGGMEEVIPYDPEKAMELLKEAGYENGFEFTVITIDTIRKNTLEYIKLDLARVGIQLNYDLVTMKEAVDIMTAGEHGGILVGWAFNPDPNSVLPLLLGTGSGKTMNSSNYSNEVVDGLLVEGRSESDLDKRREIYEKINTIVSEDSPIVVLQNPMNLCAALNNIEGVCVNPQGLFQYEALYRK